MTVGELIAKLQEYPPDTPAKVGGEYGIGDIATIGAYSFQDVPREIDGRILVRMHNDLTGRDGEVHISNE